MLSPGVYFMTIIVPVEPVSTDKKELPQETPAQPLRVAVYIDGFNLAYGMRDASLRCLYWLDLVKFSEKLIQAGQKLISIKYFSAPIKGHPDKNKRQATFLDATRSLGRVEVILGNYLLEPSPCRNCKIVNQIPKEKQTDTNIATHMVADAFRDRWDRAVLVTGDADLIPPISCIRRELTSKTVIVAFPPNRHLRELIQAAHGKFYINKQTLAACRLDEQITLPNGTVLTRPVEWR